MIQSGVAERSFTNADQTWFALATGDRNPMHMDVLAARRTMAGQPVVHGIHALLWALDSLLARRPELAALAAIKVSFEKMIYIGDTVRIVPVRADAEVARFDITAGATTAFTLDLELTAGTVKIVPIPEGQEYSPPEPAELTFDQMEDCCGRIALTGAVAERFPAVTAALGADRAAALARTSYMIGMVCPGLHSIFRGLHLARTSDGDLKSLCFKVIYADEDYRLIRHGVVGGGWGGTVDGYVRPKPAAQPGIDVIAAAVDPAEFAGARPLIVGGSRGLGEVVAKILAAGGAHVTITYAVGEVEAQRVQAAIAGFGGRCDIVHYDVRANARDQVASLPTVPTSLYYMATPQIFQRAEPAFSARKLNDFLAFYISGFSDLCEALRPATGLDIGIYYPSSVSLDERPANMTEYTMAKAAGEVLCADMRDFGRWRRVVVTRLPRLPTDQTATLYDADNEDPLDVMLPIVRAVQAG